MNQSSFFTNPQIVVIADASAIINLNATGCGGEILKAIPHPIAVTDNAWQELEDGALKGYDDHKQLSALEQSGLVIRVSVGGGGSDAYEQLVSGTTAQSLDDGEAATIAYAHEVRGIALIDEGKAVKLCREGFPSVETISSAELLLRKEIRNSLGADRQVAAVLNALRIGRMSIPKHLVQQVVELIGVEAARSCPSLPNSAKASRQSDR